MLQQTGVRTVIPYYEKLLERFPTLESLSAASLDDLMKVWEGLGYYARARNLLQGAQFIVKQREGKIPHTYEDWLEVPGVGPVTAAALASYISRDPFPALDGNMRRVIFRLFAIRTRTSQKAAKRRLYSIAKKLVASEHPDVMNQALMELGATVCTPRHPRCGSCPVSSWCKAFRLGHPEAYPGRPARLKVKEVNVVAAVIRKRGKILITRRPARGLLGGLWEFPGGKIEEGESAQEALKRELREELGVDARIGREIWRAHHRYTHMKVHLIFFEAKVGEGPIVPGRGCSEWAWVQPKQLSRFAFPAADKGLVERLIKGTLR